MVSILLAIISQQQKQQNDDQISGIHVLRYEIFEKARDTVALRRWFAPGRGGYNFLRRWVIFWWHWRIFHWLRSFAVRFVHSVSVVSAVRLWYVSVIHLLTCLIETVIQRLSAGKRPAWRAWLLAWLFPALRSALFSDKG